MSQTVWYVDVSGDDLNDGRSAIRPLATMNELERRMRPKEPCRTCDRQDHEDGYRAGCPECTVRSVMET